MDRLLKAKNLSVAYNGGTTLLSDVSFSLAKGEHLGLSGKSGSGKTTLLRLFAGLYGTESSPQVEGSLCGNGLNLMQLSPKQAVAYRSSFVGRVTEDPGSGLHPQRTIAATLSKLGNERAFRSTLASFGLSSIEDLINRFPAQLSGGEAQRIRIAFALHRSPQVLLMESPTASLDSITASLVLTKVDEMVAQGLGVLHVSHDLQLLNKVASRRLHLIDSNLCEKAPEIKSVIRPSRALGNVVIACKGLTVNYQGGKDNAVSEIDFSLRKGEILGLIGGSGSGKTTIGKALARIIPAEGRLEIKGENFAFAKTYFERADRRVQYVWQEPRKSLNPAFTVRQTLSGVAQIQGDNLKELLQHVELSEDYADRPILTLSTGEMQRVALARALAVQPDVLVCDELLAGVDGEARAALQETLFSLTQTRGLSILYITHDLANVAGVADRILIIDKGEIVESAPAAEIFNAPKAAITRKLLEAAFA